MVPQVGGGRERCLADGSFGCLCRGCPYPRILRPPKYRSQAAPETAAAQSLSICRARQSDGRERLISLRHIGYVSAEGGAGSSPGTIPVWLSGQPTRG